MSRANLTLLYVEDDRESQERMNMILEDSVKEFYQAYNGEEGIALYKEKKPDIILSDINMPILDGLSMAKKIKEIDRDAIVIVMSAFDDRNSLLSAINIGVDYFIPKPIDIDILENKLDFFAEYLENKRKLAYINKIEKDKLYKLAHYDSLTDTPNRLFFNTKLEAALSRANRNSSTVTLFFIDLDDFKNINDTYGHAAGDKILEFVSVNIKKIIRLEDTFSRISGDEFSLIIEDVRDRNYIDILSKKILQAASTPIYFNGVDMSISCSIGISSFPKDSLLKEELIHFADIAMYKAKKSGKSNYIYYEDLGE